mgnify:CR=1 FL=1
MGNIALDTRGRCRGQRNRLQVKACFQFALPLLNQVRRAKHGEASDLATVHQLTGDQPGFDGFAEADFIGELVRRTGCGLLLDVSNVHVSCVNHGRDPQAFITALPLAATGQIHLAGFARDVDAAGDPLLIDSHGAAVADEVWRLYRFALEMLGPVPTLIERDNDVPAFPVLLAEARKAEAMLTTLAEAGALA